MNWTEHEDAFPELTHCPTCGEPVDVPWGGEDEAPMDRKMHSVSCEECNRDLRLPKYAIRNQLCCFCKVSEEEAHETVTYLTLETGERICGNCIADIRAFKYELPAQHFVAEFITDDHRQALIEALTRVADEYEGDYSFTYNANAKYGRLEPDPDDEVTVIDLIAETDLEHEDIETVEDGDVDDMEDAKEQAAQLIQEAESDG